MGSLCSNPEKTTINSKLIKLENPHLDEGCQTSFRYSLDEKKSEEPDKLSDEINHLRKTHKKSLLIACIFYMKKAVYNDLQISLDK